MLRDVVFVVVRPPAVEFRAEYGGRMVETVKAFAHWLPTIAPALFGVTLGGLAFVVFAVWFARWLERYDPKE